MTKSRKRKDYCEKCVCFKCRKNAWCRNNSCADCGLDNGYSVAICFWEEQEKKEQDTINCFLVAVADRSNVLSAVLKNCKFRIIDGVIAIEIPSAFCREKMEARINSGILKESLELAGLEGFSLIERRRQSHD